MDDRVECQYEEYGFPWLDEKLYNKGRFLTKGMIQDVLKVFDIYGMGVYIPGAVEELWKVCEDWGMYVRGDLDKPLSIDYVRRAK